MPAANRFRQLFVCVGVCWCVGIEAVPAAVIESGDFLAHVQDLRNLTFAENSGAWQTPQPMHLNGFSQAASSLISGNVIQAELQAATIGYEVVQYTDNVSGAVYHGLREANNTPTRGWGTYFVNLAASYEALIQVPHPRFDTNSWDVGARVFRDSGSRAFLMAGAHRNANGFGTADVAHLPDSIFQEAHKSWVGVSAERTTFSIHGFDDANHAFPAGTDAVLSSGDGSVSAITATLDDQLDQLGFLSYAYNTLPDNDPANVAVNELESGSTFSTLGGTTNQQGVYARGLGGQFVHVELEQSIRFNSANRVAAAAAITTTIQTSMTAVPEPSGGMLLGLAVVLCGWQRRRHSQSNER